MNEAQGLRGVAVRCWSKSDSVICVNQVMLLVSDTGGLLQGDLLRSACSELWELAGYHKINSLRVVGVSMSD